MAVLSALPSMLRRVLISSQVTVVRPTTTAGFTVTSDSSYTAGAWVQASSSGDLSGHAIVGITLGTNSGTINRLEFGHGAAGSEVLIGAMPVNVGLQGGFYPTIPAIQFDPQARTAIRCVGATTASLINGVTVRYAPRPF